MTLKAEPGIGEVTPAEAVGGIADRLPQRAAIESRGADARLMSDLQHILRQHVGTIAHHRLHPGREIDDIAFDAGGGGDAPIGFLDRLDVAPAMRPCPILRARQPLGAIAGADHAERQEKAVLDGIGKRFVRRGAQNLARRVEGDILIGVAGAGLALQRRAGEAGAQERRALPFLQLFVIGIFGEAGALGEQFGQRHMRFGAAGKAQRTVPAGDRPVEVHRAILAQRRGQRAGRGLGHRRPAEQRMRRHRRAAIGVGDAVGAHKAQLAVLDNRHRQPRHFGAGGEIGQLPVERAIVDPPVPFVGRIGQIFRSGKGNRHACQRLAAAQRLNPKPAGENERAGRNQYHQSTQHGLSIRRRPHIWPSS